MLTQSRTLVTYAAAATIVIVGVLVFLSWPDLLGAFPNSAALGSCPTAPSTTGHGLEGATALRAGSEAAKLLPSQRETVDFGRSMTSRVIILDLSLTVAIPRTTYFHVRVNPFIRADDAQLRDTSQNLVAMAKSDWKTLLLTVCFRRDGNRNTNLGDPGTYVGSVTIDDSRLITPVTVPITVTMQYPNGTFLLWLYVAAILPGAWCLWVIRDKPRGADPAFSRKFFDWLFTINGVVAIVAGSVAAFAVYVAVYLRNPTWGSSALQALTLYGAMFSAFVTTAGIASLTGLTPSHGQTKAPNQTDGVAESSAGQATPVPPGGASAAQGDGSPRGPYLTEDSGAGDDSASGPPAQ
jgi:hypothetical protein